jgi:hypothetical protein
MTRGLAGMILILSLVLAAGVPGTARVAPPPPEIKEIMQTANKPTGLYFGLMKELGTARPDWEDAADDAKQLTALVEALGKNKPAKGDATSWQTLTAEYLTSAKALEQAVLKKDKATALAVGNRMGMAFCKKCHDVHR